MTDYDTTASLTAELSTAATATGVKDTTASLATTLATSGTGGQIRASAARVKVYAADGTTARTADVGQGAGILPTSGLSFSVEVGGGGGAEFTALADDLTTLSAWDCVIHIQVLVDEDTGTWTSVAAYTLRPPFRREKVGYQRVSCNAVSLLEQWATETVILPEYTVGTMPRGAGTDRALGWMSTAYNPDADPLEAWANMVDASHRRATMPTESLDTGAPWPTTSGAVWVTASGYTSATERKLFRTSSASPLTVTTGGPVRVMVASDSPGTFYLAGEPVIAVEGAEPRGEPILFQQADLFMQPGTYAAAYDTASIGDVGGDGVDPWIGAICTMVDGGIGDWLMVTNDTDWVACRRNNEPPGEKPPGPTPGALLDYLVTEAQDRTASGWSGVTLGFSATTDSQGDAWPEILVERNVRYATDTYWSVMQMLAEALEVDVWIDPDLTLQAAPDQGIDRTGSVTLGTADIATMSDTKGADAGTWVAALALDGWVQGTQGTPRREYGMELGTAISQPVATRIITASLAENGRWDGSARLAPKCAAVPLVTFNVGDTIALDYADAPATARVLSVSANAGEGSLLWDLELVEVAS